MSPNTTRDCLLSIWIAIISIPATFLFPLVFIFVCVPIKLYAYVVSIIAKIVDPDLGQIITGLRAGQIRDFEDIYTHPRTTEVACLRFKGVLNYDQIVEAFQNKVVCKLNDSQPYAGLHYPELRQYFTKFMGYVFLKNDRTFDIKNHFRFYNEKTRSVPVNRDQLTSIWEELMVIPFARNRSTWEVVVLDNYKPDKEEISAWNATPEEKYWVAFVRMHHGLGDGFSIQKMLSFLATEQFRPQFSVKRTPLEEARMALRTVLLGPYDFIWRWYKGQEPCHSMHLPVKLQSGRYYVIESKLLSTQRVTDIKKSFQVPFTVVLVAAISGGMRKYFQTHDIPIPKYFSAGIPIATGNHSDKLTNEFLLATVEYAVNLPDPQDRIRYVKEKMDLLVSTSWINLFNLCIDIYGSLPLATFKRLTEQQIFSSTYSTQPGPSKCLTSFGSTLLEVNYSYGSGADTATFGISSLTYNGHFRMVLFMDKNAVKSRRAAEDIVHFIAQEFDVLERYHKQDEWEKSVKLD